MKKLFSIFSILICSLSVEAVQNPILTIKSPTAVKSFHLSILLKDAKKITIDNDPAYPGRKMTYMAVPASKIFEGLEIPNDATVQFNCLDGFSAALNKDRLLANSKSAAIPYIAIEKTKWPNLKNKKVSAGPFYLVWISPEKSKVSPEEWPFQLSGFEIKPSLKTQFPEIFPSHKLAADHAANRGVAVFMKNCFACHTMNGKGSSQMGPDLNMPHNPTEYLAKGFLEKLIRNPRDLREWPQSKMSAFSKDVLSDEDLSDLIAYLEHMASQRKGSIEVETARAGHKKMK